MKLINNKDFGSTNSDMNFFEKNSQNITPIKKITVYFDYENFFLTDYDVEFGTKFVAEGWNGNQIHLTGLNCGYGGTAPSGTEKILIDLGMDRKCADRIKFYPEIKVYFNENGTYKSYEANKYVCFSSQPEYSKFCKVSLGDFTYFERGAQKLYFINPQYYSPKDLYNAIDEASIYQLQYYIGEKSPLDNGYTPDKSHLPLRQIFKENIDGVNIILYGRKFDILILVDNRVSHSLLNNIYSYIFKKPLFDDILFITPPQNGIKSYISKLFIKKPKKIYGSEKVFEVRK